MVMIHGMVHFGDVMEYWLDELLAILVSGFIHIWLWFIYRDIALRCWYMVEVHTWYMVAHVWDTSLGDDWGTPLIVLAWYILWYMVYNMIEAYHEWYGIWLRYMIRGASWILGTFFEIHFWYMYEVFLGDIDASCMVDVLGVVHGWYMVWYRFWWLIFLVYYMVDAYFGIGVGAWLMHLFWYMVDASYGIDWWFGTWFLTWMIYIPCDGMFVFLVHTW